jgi:predicted lipid-binding transport protein (Tim44 family)
MTSGRLLGGVLLVVVTLSPTACTAQRTTPSASTVPAPETSSSTAAPAPASLAEAMRQWKALAGDHFAASGKALQQVSEASASGDEAELRSGCTQLHDTNTLGLQRDLPTPDPRLTDELQRMIDDINTATHACVRFVTSRADADAVNYRDYLGRAVEHLHRAKEILDADSVPK